MTHTTRVALFGLMTAAATPAFAQQHEHKAAAPAQDMGAMHCGAGMSAMMHGMPGQRGMAMPGMRMGDTMMYATMDMSMMGPPAPAMILDHKAELKLTADQVTRLGELQKQAEPECARHMTIAMNTHQAATKLLDAASPDFAAYTAKLKEAAGHMAEGHVVMAKAAVAARQVLTAAQRRTLMDLMEKMHGRR